MTDFFELLSEARRPWLDSELLKEKFLTLSAQYHPDRVHNADKSERSAAQKRYVEINAAYNLLRDPKDRLLHLLELELGAKPKDVQTIPSELIPLFTELSQVCREADGLVSEKSKTTSPLLKVEMFQHGQECTEKLTAIRQRVSAERERLLEEVRKIDARWNDCSDRKAHVQKIEELYRLLSYFTRWEEQLRERVVRLAT